jgi:hypothetical protein
MEEAPHGCSKGAVSGNLFINTNHVRQALYRKKRMDYQKDKDVVKSVKLWFKEIEDKGGKTMFVEDATLTGFAYGWCTKFQLKVNVVHAGSIHTGSSSNLQDYLSWPFPSLFQVMSENTNIYCMDSTHKTAKDIAPIEEGSKIHNSVYLFTLLVKDKDIHQGIPVAFMACKSESRYLYNYICIMPRVVHRSFLTMCFFFVPCND